MDSKDYFDTVASQWDQMRSAFFSENVREKAYVVAGVEPGRLAADLGAGTGFVTEGLLARGVRVVAVDRSAEMLQQIRGKFAACGEVECRLGDSADLPIESATIDYAFANMYLHHVEDPATAIREMSRLLKPGGRLVITDMDEHQHEFLRAEQFDRWLGFRRADVRGWFEAAGLVNVRVVDAGET